MKQQNDSCLFDNYGFWQAVILIVKTQDDVICYLLLVFRDLLRPTFKNWGDRV